jgi:hypothetical protein
VWSCNKEKNRDVHGICLCCSFSCLSYLELPIAQSSTSNTIFVSPPDCRFVSAPIGSTWCIYIEVSSWAITGVFGYKLQLCYDNTLLEAVDSYIVDGHWLTPSEPSNILLIDKGTIKHTEGYVSFAVKLLGDEAGKTGSGRLSAVKLKILRLPSAGRMLSCPLRIRNCELVDSNANIISSSQYTIADGQYSYRWFQFPYVEMATKAAELAKQVIGKTYFQGGSFSKGWRGSDFADPEEIEYLDCSGLVYWSYNKAYGGTTYSPYPGSYVKVRDNVEFFNPIAFEGADLQYRLNVVQMGKAIPLTWLSAGDLLFFDAIIGKDGPFGQDGVVDHVAMYVGEWEYEGSTCNVVEATPPRVRATTVDKIIEEIAYYAGENAFVGYGKVRDNFPTTRLSWKEYLRIMNFCRTSLVVTNPEGFTAHRDNPEVEGMLYLEFDIDEDGETDNMVVILNPALGNYSVTVVPFPDALPTESYTLIISTANKTRTLAEDVSIANIPKEPYSFSSVEMGIMAVADLNMDGIVNVVDVTIVAIAFGSKLGDPKWNEIADLDKNGIVNIVDITMVAKDYGKTI